MSWTLIPLILLGVGLLNLVVHFVYARIALPHFESAPRLEAEGAFPHPHAETFEVSTADGITLRGSLYLHEPGESRGLVLFCPETGSSHWSAMNYLEGLYEAGFDLASFDFRNQGESESLSSYEASHWLSEYEVTDALAVVDFIDDHPELNHQPLGLFGVSRGAGAALAVTAERPHIECVAVEGAFSTRAMTILFAERRMRLIVPPWLGRIVPRWHIDVTMRLMQWMSGRRRGCQYFRLEQVLPRLRHRNLLMIADGQDGYVPRPVADHLLSRMDHGTDDLWVVPGAKHNRARHTKPGEFDDRLIRFFSQLSRDAVVPTVEPVPATEAS